MNTESSSELYLVNRRTLTRSSSRTRTFVEAGGVLAQLQTWPNKHSIKAAITNAKIAAEDAGRVENILSRCAVIRLTLILDRASFMTEEARKAWITNRAIDSAGYPAFVH